MSKVDAKLEAYIGVHQGLHLQEQVVSATARADPKGTIAGQALLADVENVADEGRVTRKIVDRHETLIQRLYGIAAAASFLGAGSLLYIVGRLAHVIPAPGP